jgi:hypothetical protein
MTFVASGGTSRCGVGRVWKARPVGSRVHQLDRRELDDAVAFQRVEAVVSVSRTISRMGKGL